MDWQDMLANAGADLKNGLRNSLRVPMQDMAIAKLVVMPFTLTLAVIVGCDDLGAERGADRLLDDHPGRGGVLERRLARPDQPGRDGARGLSPAAPRPKKFVGRTGNC